MWDRNRNTEQGREGQKPSRPRVGQKKLLACHPPSFPVLEQTTLTQRSAV